jgi:Transposase IS66 family
VQYGPRIAAFLVYLLHYQLLPEDRLAELMADLFGIRLVAATIARMSRTCAAHLQDFAATVPCCFRTDTQICGRLLGTSKRHVMPDRLSELWISRQAGDDT